MKHKIVFQSDKILTYIGTITGQDQNFLHLTTERDGNIRLALARILSITELNGEHHGNR